jgi:hypothetical protein
MSNARLMCMAALVAVLSGAPARAAILWQQSFDPHSSGVTEVALHTSSTKAKSVYLYVDGGTFNSVSMYRYVEWVEFWWDGHPEDLYLNGNEFFNFLQPEMHPPRRMSQLIYNKMPTYNHCDREPKVIYATCAQQELDQFLVLNSAIVAADGRFTLTLSTERVAVPEPLTWALMVAGFGGLGSMLRRNRRRTAL